MRSSSATTTSYCFLAVYRDGRHGQTMITCDAWRLTIKDKSSWRPVKRFVFFVALCMICQAFSCSICSQRQGFVLLWFILRCMRVYKQWDFVAVCRHLLDCSRIFFFLQYPVCGDNFVLLCLIRAARNTSTHSTNIRFLGAPNAATITVTRNWPLRTRLTSSWNKSRMTRYEQIRTFQILQIFNQFSYHCCWF